MDVFLTTFLKSYYHELEPLREVILAYDLLKPLLLYILCCNLSHLRTSVFFLQKYILCCNLSHLSTSMFFLQKSLLAYCKISTQ